MCALHDFSCKATVLGSCTQMTPIQSCVLRERRARSCTSGRRMAASHASTLTCAPAAPLAAAASADRRGCRALRRSRVHKKHATLAGQMPGQSPSAACPQHGAAGLKGTSSLWAPAAPVVIAAPVEGCGHCHRCSTQQPAAADIAGATAAGDSPAERDQPITRRQYGLPELTGVQAGARAIF